MIILNKSVQFVQKFLLSYWGSFPCRSELSLAETRRILWHGILEPHSQDWAVHHRAGWASLREGCSGTHPRESPGRRFFWAEQIPTISGSCYHHRLFDIFLLRDIFQKNLHLVSRLQSKKEIPTNLYQRQDSRERPHTRNFSVHATKSFVTSRCEYVLRRGGFAGLRAASEEETGSKQTIVRCFPQMESLMP